MIYDEDQTLRVGEPYFHVRDLSREEKDALVTLSGLPPYDEDDEDEDEDELLPEPRQQLLQFFLGNAIQYASREAFNADRDEAFADLSTFSEYLLDAMSLMSKADEDQLEELVLAALMAKFRLDEAIYGGKPAQALWQARVEGAHRLYERCIRRPANDN